MFEAMLTEEQRALRDEVREFVRSVPGQLILDMDADRVHYSRDFVRETGQRNLLGRRFPPQYGGRGLRWEKELLPGRPEVRDVEPDAPEAEQVGAKIYE